MAATPETQEERNKRTLATLIAWLAQSSVQAISPREAEQLLRMLDADGATALATG